MASQVSCGHGTAAAPRPQLPATVEDHFESEHELASHWTTDAAREAGAAVELGPGYAGRGLTLSLAEGGTATGVVLRRRIDASSLRGHRVTVRARSRVAAAGKARARLELRAEGLAATTDYLDLTRSRDVVSTEWLPLGVVMDVGDSTTSLVISLVLDGVGAASFDELVVEVVPTSGDDADPAVPSAEQLGRVETLLRVIGLVRHFHPADQAAQLDWDAFAPAAIARVLQLKSDEEMLAALQDLFADIAPLVEFRPEGTASSGELLRPADGAHVVRWRRIGLGPSGAYVATREGAGVDPEVSVHALAEIPTALWRGCKRVAIRAQAEEVVGATAELGLLVRDQFERKESDWQKTALTTAHEVVEVEREIHPSVRVLEVGLGLSGMGEVAASSAAVICDGREVGSVDLGVAQSTLAAGHSLFEVSTDTCSKQRCLRLSRTLSSQIDLAHDVVDVDIGVGISMWMPTAVWSNGAQTLPLRKGPTYLPAYTLADLPMRLAAVGIAWDVLRWHYPFFDDLGIDWSTRLRPALVAAASAPSPAALHDVLSVLVAELRDNHAFVKHAARGLDGLIPLSWRRIEREIVVVGGTSATLARIPVGSRIVEVEGVSAKSAYAAMDRRVSAATQGYRDFVTPFFMSLCPVGTFKDLVLEAPNGGDKISVALPCLDRDVFDPVVREPRPKTGEELAPGVVYVDLEMLDAAAWATVLPQVERAAVVVFDLRGYLTNTAFRLLGHFTDKRVWSPRFQKPIIEATGTAGYELGQWPVEPAVPRLHARAIFLVDGRSGSADETLAQIVRENQLGEFVGEPTAGTNGNIAKFEAPGGFAVRFTGMRVLLADGTSIHAKGFIPEHVVHPTLAGIREGRDEILEAAIAIALALDGSQPVR